MSRLVVEAVSAEYVSDADVQGLWLFVSVSRASDGAPVTGLTQDNFRICSPLGAARDISIEEVGSAVTWEPADEEAAGCYSLSISYNWGPSGPSTADWIKGEFYPFGIQVLVLSCGMAACSLR